MKGLQAAENHKQRQAVAGALLNTLKELLDDAVFRISPKTKLGEDISYTLNQWPKLMRYPEVGDYPSITIKQNVPVGSKNWMFSNTASGAHASAVLYSIIETAKSNEIIPFDHITTV